MAEVSKLIQLDVIQMSLRPEEWQVRWGCDYPHCGMPMRVFNSEAEAWAFEARVIRDGCRHSPWSEDEPDYPV